MPYSGPLIVRKKDRHKEDFSRALSYTFLLLKYRSRSEKEISDRLKKKGYLPAIVQQAVKYLQRNKYIDDKIFADEFVTYGFEKGWGPQKISFKLNEFGISQALSDGLISALDFRDKIRSIIHIKSKKNIGRKDVTAFRREKSRLVRVLVGRGFRYNKILKAVDEFIKD